ncbi:hypothetical protein G7Y89_g5363 [Cudoniella acicularis]|uniref:Uncharacterized protein n=1 Tax=Cudoniella acicularis TaxID=354080 RepID=A0A8H4RP54_9HELO|nr:hypothetical protein G7Y89_g5363 [Cudoniella acicularis]
MAAETEFIASPTRTIKKRPHHLTLELTGASAVSLPKDLTNDQEQVGKPADSGVEVAQVQKDLVVQEKNSVGPATLTTTNEPDNEEFPGTAVVGKMSTAVVEKQAACLLACPTEKVASLNMASASTVEKNSGRPIETKLTVYRQVVNGRRRAMMARNAAANPGTSLYNAFA